MAGRLKIRVGNAWVDTALIAAGWETLFDGNIAFAAANTWSAEQTATANLTGWTDLLFVAQDTNKGLRGTATLPGLEWDAFADVGSAFANSDDAVTVAVATENLDTAAILMAVGRGSAANKLRAAVGAAALDPMPLRVYAR